MPEQNPKSWVNFSISVVWYNHIQSIPRNMSYSLIFQEIVWKQKESKMIKRNANYTKLTN
jgi:hypothetical protein